MTRGIVLGIVGTIAVLVLAGYIAVVQGLVPANADGPYLPGERWAAKTSLRATIRREAGKQPNPLPATPANFSAGIKLYATNCAVCHGAASAEESAIAKGLYQGPPQLAKDGVEDDPDGVTYWKIEHGMRFTGMPSFGHSLSQIQIWQLTLLLKHMDALPPAAQREWKAVKNPGIAAGATATRSAK
jgi:thiosulfate dehydrogenase